MLTEKRTLDEIKVRYILESDLRDIYVEGNADVDFLKYAGEIFGWDEIVIYSADVIDIPVKDLENAGLTSGNKQKVMFLAGQFETLDENMAFPVCIIDRDDDFLFNPTDFTRLLRTDYANMNAYMHQNGPFRRTMIYTLSIEPSTAELIYSKMLEVLKFAFVMRATKRKLGGNGLFTSIVNSCLITKNDIQLDRESAIKKFIQISQIKQDNQVIRETIEEIENEIECFHPLITYNSHDFDEMMEKFINKSVDGIKASRGKALSRIFTTSVRKEDIDRKNLFINLNRLNSQ